MDNMINPSFTAVTGQLVMGGVFLTIGIYTTLHTFIKGEVVVLGKGGHVIIREKLVPFKPFQFTYIYAFIFSTLFGPGSLLIGILSLTMFASNIF